MNFVFFVVIKNAYVLLNSQYLLDCLPITEGDNRVAEYLLPFMSLPPYRQTRESHR